MNNPKFETAPKDYGLYLFVFILALGMRILFLAAVDEANLFYKYPFYAEKLAGGSPIGNRIVDLSPLYLYFLTGWKIALNIDWVFLKYVQLFIGSMNCLILMALGHLAFRKEVGFLAALLYAAYGNLIVLESTLEPTVFVLLFNLLCLFCLYRAEKTASFGKHFKGLIMAAGMFAGLSAVTKPNSLLLLPLASIWLLFFSRIPKTLGKRILATVLFCITTALPIAPITVRNHILLNDFVLITADAGKVFYHGNARGATAIEGTGLPDEGFAEEGAAEPDYAHVLYRKTASKLSGRDLSASESSLFWLQKTLADIWEEPSAYVKRQLKKLFYFFNDYEMHYIASAYKEYKSLLAYPLIRYGIIASLGLAGMLLSFKQGKSLYLIYGMVLMYLISGLLFLVQSRYRAPAVPYLSLFAAAAVYRLVDMLRTRDFRSAAATVLIVVLLFVATRFVYRTETRKVDRWQTATKIHYQLGALPRFRRGNLTDALDDLNACLALAPGFSPAYNLRGKIYALQGADDAALEDFKKVIYLSPTIAAGHKNIGLLYLLRGRPDSAKPYLVKAQTLSPGDPKINEALKDLE